MIMEGYFAGETSLAQSSMLEKYYIFNKFDPKVMNVSTKNLFNLEAQVVL